MKARLVAGAAGLAACLASTAALAEPLDPAIERLVVDEQCHVDASGAIGGIVNQARCLEDNAAFRKLIAQYGFIFAPNPTHPARTTGFGGFHVALEASYTSIDKNADYWQKGTQGAVDPSTNAASRINTGPPSVAQFYALKMRKSFGFGLEIAGVYGFMAESSLMSGGADVRLSLLEGFRTDVPGYLPDIAVGGAVRTITGTPEFQLTVAGLDTQLSKPFPIADSSIITPYIGYQYLWIFGDSGLVDLTPATDAIGYCNFTGPNAPGNPEPNQPPDPGQGHQYDGQPVCYGGSSQDFNNNRVFDQARLERQRLIVGMNYQYEMVILGVAFIADIVDPASAQTGSNTVGTYERRADGTYDPARPTVVGDGDLFLGMPRQWTLTFQAGTLF
jgi:hypothetical protein